LEKFWEKNHFPNANEQSELAEETGLRNRQVTVWFSNRRLKEKVRINTSNSIRPL